MRLSYQNRSEAGRALAEALQPYANRPDVLVLALPRGGVPIAYEVAKALGAPLDLMLVRKLGLPGHEELAMGATMQAAVAAIRPQGPAEVVVAIPVAPADTVALLRDQADAVICPATQGHRLFPNRVKISLPLVGS
jgi:putative phosphoribosyl transferase